MPCRICEAGPSGPNLADDRRVVDLRVVGEQEGLAQDDRERVVPLERQEDLARAGSTCSRPAWGRCRGTGRSAPSEYCRCRGGSCRSAGRHEPPGTCRSSGSGAILRRGISRSSTALRVCAGGRKRAEAVAIPVVDVPCDRAAVGPGRVVADAGHADKEVDIAENLGEHQGGNPLQRAPVGIGPAPAACVALRRRLGSTAARRRSRRNGPGRCSGAGTCRTRWYRGRRLARRCPRPRTRRGGPMRAGLCRSPERKSSTIMRSSSRQPRAAQRAWYWCCLRTCAANRFE